MNIFFLSTERIVFSNWTESDEDKAVLLWGNPDVTRFICASGKFSLEEISARLRREITFQRENGVQYWPVYRPETCDLIGCCGLHPHGDDCYELGFHLRPEYWHQGYASEAARAAIDYAFGSLNANRLFAGHNPQNKASKKVLQRLGFVYVGDEFYEPTGLYHPSYILEKQ